MRNVLSSWTKRAWNTHFGAGFEEVFRLDRVRYSHDLVLMLVLMLGRGFFVDWAVAAEEYLPAV